MGLYRKLQEYSGSDYYSMCMPGHKRNAEWVMENPYSLDITEIDGFDNLHDPEDILKEAQEEAAAVYGSDGAMYLINGSTAGLLIAISSLAAPGTTIIAARNSHKAVYHAAALRQLKIEYLYPDIDQITGLPGSISPEQVRDALREHPEAVLVAVTSPTYEGVVSDIRGIAEIVHTAGKRLLVDAAHGAHFGFHPFFPENAIKQGADLVIQSLHKTLPSLTQTALLHWNNSSREELQDKKLEERLRRYSGIYQSSSPSYVLMAGISRCIRFLQKDAETAFQIYAKRLQQFYQEMSFLKSLSVLPIQGKKFFFGRDPGKLVILCAGIWITIQKLPEHIQNQIEEVWITEGKEVCLTGKLLYHLLRCYQIQPELAMADYILCMTSVCDTQEGFQRLQEALCEIDTACCRQKNKEDKDQSSISERQFADLQNLRSASRYCHLYEAEERKSYRIPLKESAGYIAAEMIFLYPPGIPYVVPGEVLEKELVQQLLYYQSNGLQLKGMQDQEGKNVRVLFGKTDS